jgi:hypothetical protein
MRGVMETAPTIHDVKVNSATRLSGGGDCGRRFGRDDDPVMPSWSR